MRILLLWAALVVTPGLAQAQGWPQKPVRFVVAFPPGGSTDIAVRSLTERISQGLGQPVVVENRTGAGGNIAAEYVLKQPADGTTVLATADSLASNPHLYKLSFDPRKDFVPVMQLTRQPVVLAVHPSLGASSVAELIAIARAKPGLGYATSGSGSVQHMAGEWFAKLAGIQLTHVPYKGGGQAITDLLGGQVPLGSLGNTPLLPHYRAGRLKILAQTGSRRSPSMPDVPTYQEAGQKGLVLEQWLGLFVIAGSPAEAVERLNAEANRALGEPSARERYAQNGLEPVGGSAEQFARQYRDDYEKYARLIKDLSIKLD
ncbi:MAG TPA: tripartite tricarboxylate transporter substrate binding protein [Burkholderiales bacterium]|nr:tripartite tricarboxylate transporter substrate binding protein [Burkholderiales bacterium]